MTKPTLSLCMIVRDVAPYIQNCLGSILDEVDELVIVDTGSKDATLTVIRDLAQMRDTYKPLKLVIEHYSPTTNPEGFILDVAESFADLNSEVLTPPAWAFSGAQILANYGAARQKGWNFATSDFVMWIDSDDIVEGAKNIPAILDQMVSEKIDTAILSYNYEQDESGQSTCMLLRARIARRGGPAKWSHTIHEVLGPFGETKVFSQAVVRHNAKSLESQTIHRPALRNYKVLAKTLTDARNSGEEVHPRTWFYLGNESRAWNKNAARSYFQTYIEQSDWPEEKALAYIYNGQLLEDDGNYRLAQANYASAVATFPKKPEAHFGLARIAFFLKDWEECILHHERGRQAMAAAMDVLHYNPFDRLYYPAICASAAYLALGQPKKAWRIADEGLKLNPKDLSLIGAKTRAVDILARHQRRMRVVIYTGGSVESWGPHTPDLQGIGGSETAVIHMARALADRGHHVTVYSECRGHEGVYDNVKYEHYYLYNPTEVADVFISSRRPHAFNMNINARLMVLWMHDNHVGEADVHASSGFLAADTILTVSQWHRNHVLERYPFLNPRKVVATRNGINAKLYEGPLPPKKNKLIYSSSADRGLIIALDYFRHIRNEVPDAELHVFYGFDTITKMIEQNAVKEAHKEEALRGIAEIKRKAQDTPGVFLRGRIGQSDLAKEFMESKVWFYPTWFDESSCISAMEAQAAACTPITTAQGALTETVHHGYLYQPPNTSGEYKVACIKRAIWCLTHEEERSVGANLGRQNALAYHPWQNIAEEWEDLFCEQLSRS